MPRFACVPEPWLPCFDSGMLQPGGPAAMHANYLCISVHPLQCSVGFLSRHSCTAASKSPLWTWPFSVPWANSLGAEKTGHNPHHGSEALNLPKTKSSRNDSPRTLLAPTRLSDSLRILTCHSTQLVVWTLSSAGATICRALSSNCWLNVC